MGATFTPPMRKGPTSTPPGLPPTQPPASAAAVYLVAGFAEEIGLPPGVVNIVTAHRPASEALVVNPGVDKVSFTGSTVAGKRIAALCADRVARVNLELGGKSAALILD